MRPIISPALFGFDDAIVKLHTGQDIRLIAAELQNWLKEKTQNEAKAPSVPSTHSIFVFFRLGLQSVSPSQLVHPSQSRLFAWSCSQSFTVIFKVSQSFARAINNFKSAQTQQWTIEDQEPLSKMILNWSKTHFWVTLDGCSSMEEI